MATSRRPQIFAAPYPEELFDARIDDIREESGPDGTDIIFELRTLRLLTPLESREIEGKPHEVAEGKYVPMRLRFTGAEWRTRAGVFERLVELPLEHEARHLFGIQHSSGTNDDEFFWVMTGGIVEGEMTLRAHGHTLEPGEGPVTPVAVVRRYTLAPLTPSRTIPRRPALHRRYGGDPITIHLGRRVLHNRFFIGGLHHQREKRPHVDHVLNLCGVANPWCAQDGLYPSDRFATKGEMAIGMDARELLGEARWVAERLRAGKRVLVHCYAGVNRSSTVCCATLMLLEGLTAEEALARVREHHPIAWPDPYHWFLLRWLSHSADELSKLKVTTPEDQEDQALLLREATSISR